jgi:hypothetical protein
MLPHRYDAPESAMYSYTEQTLPCIPQSRWMQMLPDVVVRAAVVVANVATQMSGHNPARMFYYNCLAENGWRSNFYNEAVDLAVGMAMVQAAQNVCRHPLEAIDRCAGDALTLLVSKYILEFRELAAVCSQEQVMGASQNIALLNDQYMRIQQLQNPQQGQMYPGQYPGQPQAGMQYGAPIQVPGGRPGYPQGNLSYGGGMGYGQAYQGNPTVSLGSAGGGTDDRYAQRGGAAPVDRYNTQAPASPSLSQSDYYRGRTPAPLSAPPSTEPVSTPQPAKKYTVTDWKPSSKQYYRAVYSLDEYEATYTKFGDVVIENLNPIGENQMDRQAHSLTLGSDPIVPRTEVISRAFSEAVNLKKVSEEPRGSGDGNGEKVSEYVWPKVLLSSWLEDLIFSGKQHQRASQGKDTENGVFRCFAVLTKPFATPLDISELIEENEEDTNLTTFLEIKERILETNRKAKAVGETERATGQAIAAFAVELNRHMTGMVNSFLKNNLSLTGVEIDDFVDDIADLRDFLKASYSSAYAEAFDRFEHDMAPEIFKVQHHDFEDEQRPALAYLDKDGVEKEADNVTFLSTAYSLTYINVLASELNLNLKGEALLIKESIIPLLYHAAKSVFCKKEWMGILPTQHLVITADGVVYKLHKGYMGHESYLISKP